MPVRSRRYRDTLDWLLDFVPGKRVLYIGNVDDNAENTRKHRTVQAELARRSGSLLGVYRSAQEVARLGQMGDPAVAGDVEALELGRTFDVIVAADTIEHLANPGGFLRGLERHLAPDGVVLVSSPNPLGLVRILELLVRGSTKANPEHTCWYSPQVLAQLTRRFRLHAAGLVWIDEMHKYHRSSRGARRLLVPILIGMNRVLCRIRPQLSETFGVVLARHPFESSR